MSLRRSSNCMEGSESCMLKDLLSATPCVCKRWSSSKHACFSSSSSTSSTTSGMTDGCGAWVEGRTPGTTNAGVFFAVAAPHRSAFGVACDAKLVTPPLPELASLRLAAAAKSVLRRCSR